MKTLTPDIVIIDDKLADGSGLDFAREIKSQNSSVRTVIFSTTDTPHVALEAIECGAMGFVSKTGAAQPLASISASLLLIKSSRDPLHAGQTA